MTVNQTVRNESVKVSVRVRLPQARVFQLFTGDIERWWRRGPKYRNAGVNDGLIHIEPQLNGRVFESWRDRAGERVFEIGRVLTWEPPERFAFSWRNSVFAENEQTTVEVTFTALGDATEVTVVHRGWETIRPDHPARHGLVDAGFQRSLGLWWGAQLSMLREIGSGMNE